MAKSKKKRVKRVVGSTGMDVGYEPITARSAGAATLQSEGMDTEEVVVTDIPPASKKLSLGVTGVGRVAKKGPQKRRAFKLRKEKAVMRAISLIEKQERRVTQAELKKYSKQELKKLE